MGGRARASLAEQFREHAAVADRMGAPLYGVLLRGFAADWTAGGPLRRLCAGWEGRPVGHAVQLRLLGGLHRLVLSGSAPELARFYRSVGGQADPSGAWPVARAVIAEYEQELRGALEVAPQTNEPGRAAALAVGLLVACARHGMTQVRLLELGASAGLNLRVDRYRITGQGWAWGPADSPVDLSGAVLGRLDAAAAALAGSVRIVSRRGCDLAPVEAHTAEGRLRLTSFVWPDHDRRHRRLAGALAVSADLDAAVDRAAAADWLQLRLAEPVGDGVLSVVWHSVFWQYVPQDERTRIQALLSEAAGPGRLAVVALESATVPYRSDPTLKVDGCLVATATAHGVPLRLL